MKFVLVALCLFAALAHAKTADVGTLESSSLKCKLCDAVVDYAKEKMEEKVTSDVFVADLDKVCNEIPGKLLKKECAAMVKKFGPEIYQMLDSKVDSSLICGKIKMCKPAHENITPKEKCDMCVDLVGFTFDEIEKHVDSKKIVDDVTAQCDSMHRFSGVCKDFIAEFGPKAIGFLESKMDKNAVCQKLKVCPAPSVEVELDLSAVDEAADETSAKCELCTMLASFAKKEIEKIPADAVTAKLKAGCSKLKKLGGVCADAVDKFGPAIIKKLEDKANPQEVCELVKACPQEEAVITPEQKCELCEALVGFAKEEVEKHVDSKKVVDDVTAQCEKLPKFSGVCKDFVAEFGPKAIGFLESKMDEKLVCAEFKVCPAPSTQYLRSTMVV